MVLGVQGGTRTTAGFSASHLGEDWDLSQLGFGEVPHLWCPPHTPHTGGPRLVGWDRSLTAREVWFFVFLCGWRPGNYAPYEDIRCNHTLLKMPRIKSFSWVFR